MNIQKVSIAIAMLFLVTLMGCGDKEKPYTADEIKGIKNPPPKPPPGYKPDTRGGGGPPPATN